ncbi:MAG: efflux RND transporter periplasmic adaptor subunit [Bacteroidales bacterium]|nr:efflux RND transporter periplasmic adaptor subunit [Bacteroidales bacterium]
MKLIKFLFFLLLISPVDCRNVEVRAPSGEISRVRVITVKLEAVALPVHSGGILATAEDIRLSFKTGGVVGKINVNEGDKVKEGQVLASLDLAEISANVSLAANLYEKARRDLARVKNLYADTVATLEQLQNATTALNVARSNLEIAEFNLAHSTIKAPDEGVILRQLVRTNEMVASGYPVFLFGTSGKFWKVRSGFSDRDVVKIYPGDSAVVRFDAWPGVDFRATVDRVSGISNPMTGTYEIELIMEGKGYRLASGFVASVDVFPASEQNMVLLPVSAIVDAAGNKGSIWSVSDSGTVFKIETQIETISGQMVAVKGIPGGISRIVSEGAAYLREGEKVLIVE